MRTSVDIVRPVKSVMSNIMVQEMMRTDRKMKALGSCIENLLMF